VADALPGRATAMAHLEKALLRAASGAGTFVTVRGPMGAGKSALLRTLAVQADAAGETVLRASGAHAERDWDFGVADQLRPVPDGFVVVVVDDLHWADESSVRWLAGLAERALVLAGIRDGEPGADVELPGSVVRLRTASPARWSRHGLAACLSRQPGHVRDAARALAVLGDEADLDLVTALAGLDDVTGVAAVRTLRSLGLVTSQRNPRFADPSVREVVLAGMTPTEHDDWHAAARVLRPRAVVPSTGPDRAALLTDLAVAASPADDLLALHHLSCAVQSLDSARDRAAAVLRMPLAALDAAPALARDVIDDIGHLGDRELASRIEARLRYAGHADPAELTDATARLRELDPQPAATAHRELLTVLAHSAALEARVPAHEIGALAAGLLDQAPPGEMTHLLVKTLCAADFPLRATGWADPATGALVAAHRGDVTQARLLANVVLDRSAVSIGPDAALALALVALKIGHQRLPEHLLKTPAGQGDPRTVLMLDLVRAVDAVTTGDDPEALRRLADTGRRLDRLGRRNVVLFPWRTAVVRLHQQLGDDDTARTLAEEDHERAVEWGAPAGVGRTLRVLGRLTGGERGLDMVRAAADVLAGSSDRLELARTHLALGLWLRGQHEHEATDHLLRCRDTAIDCGDQRLVRQARAHLRGEVRRAELTRTERKVVALVVAGRSNREIAHALLVSVRAVEKHLTNSYRKLGVEHRAELPGALSHPIWT
jgi:DNA-binding CsgD family transcriptional regulator/ABC-type cobalamin/Fe3+-siderophores transport system ATPase subunit